ncbi:MAG: tetratricopeptide repeat protein [Flavobacteriaceae bacterium]|nr:tetratricopeptide repeat protein [Flavobacteriaceae bacterium]
MRYKFFTLFIFLLFWFNGHTQSNIDSLDQLIIEAVDDYSKIQIIQIICENYENSDSEVNKYYIDKLLEFSKDKDIGRGIIIAYNNYGVYYLKQGKYKKALENFLQTINIAKEKKIETYDSKPFTNIGLIYYYLKQYDKSIEYGKKALIKAQYSNGKKDSISALTNLGITYHAKGELKKALKHYEKANELAKIENDQKGRVYNMCNIGLILVTEKKHDKALQYYFKALELAKNENDKYGMAYIYTNIGSAYKELKINKKAKLNLERGLIFAKEINEKNIEKEIYLFLSKIYSEEKEFDTALIFHQKHTKIKDSLLNKNTSEKIVEMESKYQLKEKEAKISVITKNLNQLLIVGVLVLIITIYFVFSFYKKRKKAEIISVDLKTSHHNMLMKYKNIKNINQQYKEELLKIAKKLETERIVNKKGIKYKFSPLSIENKNRYLSQILDYIEIEQPYLETDLNLEVLSKKINIKAHYISEVLNDTLGQSFYNLINSYRVEEFKKEVLKGKLKAKTILGVAFECGFNSKTSFNRIFKNHTNITPSQFKKDVN